MTVQKRTTIEFLVLIVLATVLLGSLLPSIRYARREARDGLRRTELLSHKQKLEEINNKEGYYPLLYTAAPYQYVVLKSQRNQAIEWYLRTPLENKTAPASGFDEEYNIAYRIVEEEGASFYDICGGNFQCGASPRQ